MEIAQRDNPILRGKAKAIPLDDIGSPKIQGVIEKMKLAVHSQKDGIAIAAPQIGELLQIFVVNGELMKAADKNFKGGGADLVFINPKIVKLSKDRREMEEGCLSVRWLYGKVKRSTRASLAAYDEKGNKINRGASGLLAQIFQHECDHLEGILFTDKAKKVWEMAPEEIEGLKNSVT
ncbi:peptide deformylase [Patescibacteria group bacterium]|nr:peptide deformylase [Patescibacteria group bacterium]MDE1946472.1 peptide deformylase [Patescibacteria group bacterium]